MTIFGFSLDARHEKGESFWRLECLSLNIVVEASTPRGCIEKFGNALKMVKKEVIEAYLEKEA